MSSRDNRILNMITFLASILALAASSTPALSADDAPAPTDHLARLRELKPNHAVLLGKAKVIGEFNDVAKQFNLHKTGPRGRDFTIKMVWAPDRKRALFCGANHGVPHRLNDVWEFDLAALEWRMLYAPDNARDYGGLGKDPSDVEFKDGTFITKRGGPGIIAHTWWGLTYDPKAKALLFMNTWVTNEKKAAEQLGGDPAQLYQGPPLWAFHPETARWEFLKTPTPYPKAPFGGLLEYVPELGGTIWHVNNWQMRQSWHFDFEKRAWKPLDPNGGGKPFEQESPEPEQVGYYDPTRKMIVTQRHWNTHHYDIKTNTWKKIITRDKDAPDVPYGHDARAPMYHDPASGHGLLVQFQTNTLWAYDPDAAQWHKLQPQGDPLPESNKRLAYVDPEHNVLVVIKDTEVWAYRYAGR